MNCARHGIPMRLYDIYGGEARKYPLACIEHLVQQLNQDQTLLIMYDIICLCKQKLQACIPELRNRDPFYLVTVFHAYAHSMHCQVEFHPRVVDGSGYTDGEGVERFWSILNRFSGMTRSMSKYNRKALITDVVNFFKQNKMIEIPNQVFKKYNNALSDIKRLNITNKKYTELSKDWEKYVKVLATPATPSGIKDMLERAEKQSRLANKSEYIRLCAEYLQITEDLKDPSNKKITNTRLIAQSNSLYKKIRALRDKYGFRIITRLDDRYFLEHEEEVKVVRYNTQVAEAKVEEVVQTRPWYKSLLPF